MSAARFDSPAEYGLVRPLFRWTEEGGRTLGGPNQLAVTASVPVTVDGATMRATFAVGAGDTVGFALWWSAVESDAPQPTPAAAVPARIDDTIATWRSWEALHDIYPGANHELVRFSSRVLKGLTYRPTGAMVAAPTTSLREAIGGERTWDYRYAWIRDASFTMQALFIGSCPVEVTDFVSFMTGSAGGGAQGSRMRPRESGSSPTPGCGTCGVSPDTTCPPRCCAGRRSTVRS